MFRGIAQCTIGNGSTIHFWSDVWNGQLLQEKFPRLFSFTRNRNISVQQSLTNSILASQFYLPMTAIAYQEFEKLQHLIQDLQYNPQQKDKWHYIWGAPKYTSSAFYNYPYKFVHPPQPFLWLWNYKCCNKLRVFTWLLFMDRLSIRNILKRKKHKLNDNNYNCVLCDGGYEETAFHLFFSCTFSQQCWVYLGILWNFTANFFNMLNEAKSSMANSYFMEIFIIAA